MPKVMVIDDDRAIVELMEMMLAVEGFRTTSICKSTNALDHVRQEMPDLILLDLMMPEVDGWQVLSALKSDPNLQHIPVIVVTARVDAIVDPPGDLVSNLAGHLIKPFEVEDLVCAINRVLDVGEVEQLEMV